MLVVQASLMGEGGEIFILKMGEPIRIAELARDLIALHGLTRGHRREASSTQGCGPARNCTRALIARGREAVPSRHPHILRAVPHAPAPASTSTPRLATLTRLADGRRRRRHSRRACARHSRRGVSRRSAPVDGEEAAEEPLARCARTFPRSRAARPSVRSRCRSFARRWDEDDIAAVADALRSGWLTSGPRAIELETASRRVSRCGAHDRGELVQRSDAPVPARTRASAPATKSSPRPSPSRRRCTRSSTTAPHRCWPTSKPTPSAWTPPTSSGASRRARAPSCRCTSADRRAASRRSSRSRDSAGSTWWKTRRTRSVRASAASCIGGFGRATAFSFYATKNLTTAEGGAITTEDDALAQQLRLLGYHGMSRDSWSRYSDKGSWYYQVEVPGYKCNLSDLHAALGLTQLAKIDHPAREAARGRRRRSPGAGRMRRRSSFRASIRATGTRGTCT